jgi:hypothetical protein
VLQCAQVHKTTGRLLDSFLDLGVQAGFAQSSSKTIPFDAPSEMLSRNVKTELVTYKGQQALRVTDTAASSVGDAERLVLLTKTEFQDGVIAVRGRERVSKALSLIISAYSASPYR